MGEEVLVYSNARPPADLVPKRDVDRLTLQAWKRLHFGELINCEADIRIAERPDAQIHPGSSMLDVDLRVGLPDLPKHAIQGPFAGIVGVSRQMIMCGRGQSAGITNPGSPKKSPPMPQAE